MQIASVRKIQKHHPGQLPVKIFGKRHHIILVKSGNAQVLLHTRAKPWKVYLPTAVSPDQQTADFMQDFLVGDQRIAAFQNTEQPLGIPPLLPREIHHLQKDFLLHDAIFDRIGQHLFLKEIQLAQHCRIHTENIPRLNINHRRGTVMNKQLLQKQPPAGNALHILLRQVKQQPRDPPVTLSPAVNP